MSKDLRILKDMGRYLPAQIVPGLIGFVGIPLITSLLEPEEYGDYVLVRSVTRLLAVVASWSSISLLRVYPECEVRNRLPVLHATILKAMLVTAGTLTFLAVAILGPLHGRMAPELYRMLWLGLALFSTACVFDLLLQFLRSRRAIGWYSGMQCWQSVVGLGLGLLLERAFGLGGVSLLLGLLASQVVAVPVLWRLSGLRVRALADRGDVTLVRTIAGFGVPLAVANLSGWVLSLGDRYVLQLLKGAEEVGIYSASYGISENSMVLLASLFALASGSLVFKVLEEDGEDACRRFMATITRYYLIVATPAAVLLTILARPVLSLLLQESYQEGYRAIPWVVSGAFLLGLQQRFHAGVSIARKNAIITVCVVISGVANVGLNFLIVPRYGFVGAGVATFVSYVMLTVLIILLSRRHFTWTFPFKSLIRVAVAAGIMGAVLHQTGGWFSGSVGSLALQVVAGLTLYGGVLAILGELPWRDLLGRRKRAPVPPSGPE